MSDAVSGAEGLYVLGVVFTLTFGFKVTADTLFKLFLAEETSDGNQRTEHDKVYALVVTHAFGLGAGGDFDNADVVAVLTQLAVPPRISAP